MNKLIVLMLACSFASGCASLSGPSMGSGLTGLFGGSSEVSEVEVVATGHDYNQLEPQQRLINNKMELAAWLLGNEQVAIEVAGAAEGVDFSTHKLVYVAAGIKPHSGYTLALSGKGFSHFGGAASVALRLEQPAPGAFFPAGVTSPYILLKVPAEDYRRIAVEYEACDQRQQILVSR